MNYKKEKFRKQTYFLILFNHKKEGNSATIWINLGDIMLWETNQTEKNTV